MTISKLGRALKARFPGPRGVKRVAAILGIDENLIANAAPDPAVGGNSESNSKANVQELRHAFSEAIEKAGLSNRIHEDVAQELLEILDSLAPAMAPALDGEKADLEGFLKKSGLLTAADVKHAMDLVSRARSARDAMPNPGLPSRGGMGGATSGSKYSPPELRLASDARLRKRFPGIELVRGEIVDRRHAMDARPDFSSRALERFAKRYPNAAAIQ